MFRHSGGARMKLGCLGFACLAAEASCGEPFSPERTDMAPIRKVVNETLRRK